MGTLRLGRWAGDRDEEDDEDHDCAASKLTSLESSTDYITIMITTKSTK